ncbi:MAG: hypothetical protein OXC30_01150 [Alphaproteobacteria bacterium]|nr:hypothetical protein [Alphaproteobacteria bacterium]
MKSIILLCALIALQAHSAERLDDFLRTHADESFDDFLITHEAFRNCASIVTDRLCFFENYKVRDYMKNFQTSFLEAFSEAEQMFQEMMLAVTQDCQWREKNKGAFQECSDVVPYREQDDLADFLRCFQKYVDFAKKQYAHVTHFKELMIKHFPPKPPDFETICQDALENIDGYLGCIEKIEGLLTSLPCNLIRVQKERQSVALVFRDFIKTQRDGAVFELRVSQCMAVFHEGITKKESVAFRDAAFLELCIKHSLLKSKLLANKVEKCVTQQWPCCAEESVASQDYGIVARHVSQHVLQGDDLFQCCADYKYWLEKQNQHTNDLKKLLLTLLSVDWALWQTESRNIDEYRACVYMLGKHLNQLLYTLMQVQKENGVGNQIARQAYSQTGPKDIQKFRRSLALLLKAHHHIFALRENMASYATFIWRQGNFCDDDFTLRLALRGEVSLRVGWDNVDAYINFRNKLQKDIKDCVTVFRKSYHQVYKHAAYLRMYARQWDVYSEKPVCVLRSVQNVKGALQHLVAGFTQSVALEQEEMTAITNLKALMSDDDNCGIFPQDKKKLALIAGAIGLYEQFSNNRKKDTAIFFGKFSTHLQSEQFFERANQIWYCTIL